MYAAGDKVDRDEAKALHWFRKSAAQEHAAAEYQVGLRYYAGSGLPKDQQKAFNYYRSAALQGHAKAQYSLGIMLSNGQHVQHDDIAACAWFTIAAESGISEAQDLHDPIHSTLTKSEKQKLGRQLENLRDQLSF